NPTVFESISCSEVTFAAYDSALATGYGELQRLIGPDLQYGPRSEEDLQVELFTAAPQTSAGSNSGKLASSANSLKPGAIPA
ncbi:MAG: hypothetical protein JF626_02805, partial [Polaromonas sp.]|nr:hypothetical protein [Polaromonas sp.]